jgi:hypothetical protein
MGIIRYLLDVILDQIKNKRNYNAIGMLAGIAAFILALPALFGAGLLVLSPLTVLLGSLSIFGFLSGNIAKNCETHANVEDLDAKNIETVGKIQDFESAAN